MVLYAFKGCKCKISVKKQRQLQQTGYLIKQGTKIVAAKSVCTFKHFSMEQFKALLISTSSNKFIFKSEWGTLCNIVIIIM